jgi:hypothetical protein
LVNNGYGIFIDKF